MGNRAILTFSTDENAPALYLHWNGGRASVLGMLKAARQLGIVDAARAKCGSDEQLRDELGHMIAGRFFGVELDSLHVYRCEYAGGNCGDNGVYLLGRDLTIENRLQAPPVEELDGLKTAAIFDQIINATTERA
jgi:hypothetical protein